MKNETLEREKLTWKSETIDGGGHCSEACKDDECERKGMLRETLRRRREEERGMARRK